MRSSYAVSLALILVGCAGSPLSNMVSQQRYQTTWDVMASWIGSSEDEVVTSWGPPDNSHTLSNGSKLISYEYTWNTNSLHERDFGYTHPSSDYAQCVQKFLIEEGVITKWNASKSCRKTPKGAKLIPRNTPIPRPTM